MKRLAWVLAWLWAPVAMAQSAAPAEQLREVEAERGRVELLLRQLADRQSEVLGVLESAEHEARAAEREAAEARKRVRETQTRIAQATEKEARLEAQRVEAAKALGPQLRLRYRLRTSSLMASLLSAPSVGDLLWRRRMVDRLLRGDLELIERLDRLTHETREARAQVEREQAEARVAADEAKARAQRAQARRGEHTAVLQALRQEKRTHERAVQELETSRRSLLEALAKLPPTPDGLGGFGARRGRLPWPVDGELEERFGPRVDRKLGITVQNKGWDVRAPAGTPVKAVYPAVVGFAGWFRGFGHLVVLDHGEGYFTLYAHLAELHVERGARVSADEALGTVGDTGSLKGAYLYFEVRSGARALDPADWLTAPVRTAASTLPGR